jgi:hypothetical protein
MKTTTKLKPVATLASLAVLWLDAKVQEKAANERRVAIEADIAAMLPAKSEGAVTETVGTYKIVCDYKLTRSVDSDKLQEAWATLDPHVQAAFAWKASVKVGELRKVQEFMPEAYTALAQIIEVKPAKTSVKVELLEVA